MKKILIIFAHPAFARSRINAALRNAVADLDGITFHDLYATYPDFHIDVDHEQKLCENHDILIFQHPFYWYSTPAILKEWFDLVLQHGWAYGLEGRALEGKYVLQALTAGGDNTAYQRDGSKRFTIGDLTTPFRATANLCRMEWLPPFTALGIHMELPEKEISHHTKEYQRALTALRDEKFDIPKVKKNAYLNSDLNSTIKQG